MNDIEGNPKDFLLDCIEQCKVMYPDPSTEDRLYTIIVQLTGKVFALEEQIKGLNK